MLMTLFSLVFWLWFALSSVVMFVIAFLVWLVALPFDPNTRALHWWSCAWAALYIYSNPLWSVRCQNTRGFNRKRPYVIVANHQSLGDILVLYTAFLPPFKWVSKASVFKVPFIGWNMRLNRYVEIVRGDKDSAAKMGAACRAWIERGVSVLLFPEGTRSHDGEIHDFKVGAFRIAREAGCEVLPIVLDGTGDVLPKHGIKLQGRVRAKVRVLEPMDVAAFPSHEAAAEAVRARMVAELSAMRGRAGQGDRDDRAA